MGSGRPRRSWLGEDLLWEKNAINISRTLKMCLRLCRPRENFQSSIPSFNVFSCGCEVILRSSFDIMKANRMAATMTRTVNQISNGASILRTPYKFKISKLDRFEMQLRRLQYRRTYGHLSALKCLCDLGLSLANRTQHCMCRTFTTVNIEILTYESERLQSMEAYRRVASLICHRSSLYYSSHR